MTPNLACIYCGEKMVCQVGDDDCLLVEPCGCDASTAKVTRKLLLHNDKLFEQVENRKANQQQDYATLEAECERLREVLAAARKFIPVAGPDGYSTALADAIARYDRDKEAKP